MKLKINTLLAKKVSYGDKRPLSDVKYIVIHYTGNVGDTAAGNANYFANGNTRSAGAHFFVDKDGVIFKSVNMNRIAWAVGGNIYSTMQGAATYYGKCTNSNSISIELCDCSQDTNWSQILAVRSLVAYIQEKCPNAKTIIRHWDVNGKACPAPMIGEYNEKWERMHSFITKGYQFKAKVIKRAAIRSSGKITATNKIGTAKKGKIVKITKVVGKWGRLKEKDAKGRYQWIILSKIKKC